jgi:hypothetical protein
MSEEPPRPDDHSFDDSGIDRRTFVRLSAATGAALALPGNAGASVAAPEFDAEYQYVLNHTPVDHRVPTLVEFSGESGLDALDALVDGETVETTEPAVAAHARLTASRAQAVSELPTAETFTYAPGANPFWRLGYYPLGVFPDSERCVDFVVYEEMIAGMEHLAEQHPDRLDFYAIGNSPGYENAISDRVDPKPVYVAELTNDIDDEAAYREKEKVFCSLSLHGDERAGAEAGCRFTEQLLRGTERETERLLDDAVVVLAFTNPDGWVARHPQYEGKFQRGNARVGDTNRQYPIVGWIDPSYYPAEPRGADAEDDREGIDSDVPREYLENVPDTLAIVEHFRTYENLNYGADFHGASVFSDDFVFGLISQAQYDHREFHELYGLNRDIDEALTEELQPLPYTSNDYDYATIWDLLGYTDSGIQGDWLAHPKSLGGLGMTSMDFEMAHANIATSTYYDPNRNDKQVRGYQQGIRTITEFAVQNTDTRTTDDEFGATVETGGLSTAVVTTDAITRSSEQLIQLDATQLETLQETNFSGVIGPGALGSTTQRHEFDVSEDAIRITATLSWARNTQDNDFFLENPDGERIAGSQNFGGPEQLSTSVEGGGTYAYVVETFANVAANYEIEGEVQGVSDDADVTTNGGDGGDGELTFVDTNTAVSRAEETLSVADGGSTTALSVPADTHTLSVSLDADGPVAGDLRSPSGETVRSYDATDGPMVDGPGVDWAVRAPEAGAWTVAGESRTATAEGAEETATGETVTIQTTTMETGDRTLAPSPEVVLGYEQFDYKVSPLTFFDSDFFADDHDLRSLTEDRDLDDFADAPVDTLSVADVGNGDHRTYDNLVVVHDDGIGDDGYVGQLDSFVEDGGNLVVTDTGVNLLTAMDSDLTAGIGAGDTTRETYYVAHLGEKNPEHPLLEDARPVQNQLWKVAGLGYSVGTEAPMTLVDDEAFEAAGGVPAGAQAEGVSAGSLLGDVDEEVTTRELVESDAGSVHFVGGVFPPASQANLHPFGLLDYSASFLGYLLLTNALGYVQKRSIGGETTASFGGDATFAEGGGGNGDGLRAEGSRADDGTVHSSGRYDHVTITVESLSATASISDRVPEGWTVDAEYGDVERVEDGRVYLGDVGPVGEDETVTLEYFVRAPEGPGGTGSYEFGPARAETDSSSATFGGTDTNFVVGVDV